MNGKKDMKNQENLCKLMTKKKRGKVKIETQNVSRLVQ